MFEEELGVIGAMVEYICAAETENGVCQTRVTGPDEHCDEHLRHIEDVSKTSENPGGKGGEAVPGGMMQMGSLPSTESSESTENDDDGRMTVEYALKQGSVNDVMQTVFSTVERGDIVLGLFGMVVGIFIAHQPDVYTAVAQVSPLILGGGSLMQRLGKARGKQFANPYSLIRYADAFFAMLFLSYATVLLAHQGESLDAILRALGF